MYQLIKKLNINISLFKNLSKIRREKLNILLFILLILLIIVIIIVKYLAYNVYEPIDYKNKLIFLGQTCDLENNNVSIQYSYGFQLAFSYFNKIGLIDGYKIKLILLNDKYEPNLATKNAKLLIDYYNVLGLIGSFGTPTTVSILNDAIYNRNIPLIAPFSGSNVFRQSFDKHIILTNYSFLYEYKLITENLIQNNFKNISFIYQNDIYGTSYYDAFLDYILQNNLQFNIVSTGKYERSTEHIDEVFIKLFDTKNPFNYSNYNLSNLDKIDAVIVIAAQKEINSIIAQLKKIKPSIAIYYNSFIGNNKNNVEYLKYLNKDNIYQTLLSYNSLNKFPDLNNKLLNEIDDFNKNNNKQIKDITSSLIQGFYSGLLICKVIQSFKDITQLNRNSFIERFYELKNIDVFGLKMGPFILNKSNDAIKYVELNKLNNDLEFETIATYNKN